MTSITTRSKALAALLVPPKQPGSRASARLKNKNMILPTTTTGIPGTHKPQFKITKQNAGNTSLSLTIEKQQIKAIIEKNFNKDPDRLKKLNKDLRGLDKNQTLGIRLQQQRKHILVPIQDREQCEKTIGEIDCFGKIRCYLCGEPVITHVKNFRKNCKNIYGDKMTPLHLPWFNERNQSIDNDAPECDHILPCSPADEDFSGWGLNRILYSLLAKLLSINGNNIPFAVAGSEGYDQRYYDYLKTYYRSNNKLKFFLNAIIKSNYGWTHRICNNKKTNLTCLIKDTTSGDYSVDLVQLNYMSERFILTNQWTTDIFNHFKNLDANNPQTQKLLLNTKIQQAVARSKDSMKNKFDLICLILNENKDYVGYTPTANPAKWTTYVFGGAGAEITSKSPDIEQRFLNEYSNNNKEKRPQNLTVSIIPSSANNLTAVQEEEEVSEKLVDKEKINIIAERILDSTGENEKDRQKRLYTYLFLMNIDEIKDTSEYKKAVEELNDIYEDFLKSKDFLNDLTDEDKEELLKGNDNPTILVEKLKTYLNFLNRQLPDYKNNYKQEYLQYIDKIKNTHENQLFIQLILFDFSKFEKFKFFSFGDNFAKYLIDNEILIINSKGNVIFNIENKQIKYTHYKQTFFFNYFDENNEIKEEKKSEIIQKLKKLNKDTVFEENNDKLINEKLLEQFEERYRMIDDKTKLNDIYINWYYFNIFQLLLCSTDDQMRKLFDGIEYEEKEKEIEQIIEEIKKIKKIMPVEFSDNFAAKVKEANENKTKMQELFQDVRRTCFQLSIGHGLLYNDEKFNFYKNGKKLPLI